MSNPFLTKKDPLLEAVKGAMQDGELRRQAEALVNEEFGVYSRKAVVREQLAAYDARLEEAYKCMKEGGDLGRIGDPKSDTAMKNAGNPPMMSVADPKGLKTSFSAIRQSKGMSTDDLKEGEKKDEKKEDKPKADYSKMREKMVGKGKDLETTRKIVGEAKLAKKDYDKDGKIESPKDEVWGSRFRAAKMAGKMEEEQIDEIKVSTAYSYAGKKMEKERKGLLPGDRNPSSKTDLKNMTNAANRTDKDYYKKRGFKKMDEEQIDELYGKGSLSKIRGHHEKESDRAYDKLDKSRGRTKQNAYEKKAEYHSYQSARAEDLINKKKKKKMNEGTAEAETSMAVTRDNKPSTPAQTNAATSGPSAADKAALTSKIKTMKEAVYSAKIRAKHMHENMRIGDPAADEPLKKAGSPPMMSVADPKGLQTSFSAINKAKEDSNKANMNATMDKATRFGTSNISTMKEAAYSAKAARAGKDIGKPGKEFSKIAKKAGKRYGSEERGKKVAGAILAKIRAKHMKEE